MERWPPSISSGELVDDLNAGLIKCIQTCGRCLPSSELSNHVSADGQCEWIDFASSTANVTGLIADDLRQFFPPLEGDELGGSDGRPMLYAACLGLLFSGERRSSDTLAIANQQPCGTSAHAAFLESATFLLDEAKVDPNQPTEAEGACLRPPLHLLARSSPGAVDFLLSRGADVNQCDAEGWTALMACCMPDVKSHRDGGPSIEDRLEVLRLLLTSGADVDASNYCGYTALHYACEGLNKGLIECLLKDGKADATLKTIWGSSCAGILESKAHEDEDKACECKDLIMTYLRANGQLRSLTHFLQQESNALRLLDLVEDVLIPASKLPQNETFENAGQVQDRRVAASLMRYLGLDPTVMMDGSCVMLEQDRNTYEEIHRRVMKLVPPAFSKVYRDCSPTDEERQIITSTNFGLRRSAVASVDGIRRVDPGLVMNQAFKLHRERGHIASQMELLTSIIVRPLQHVFAFAIPSTAVVKEIASRAPRICEMGAGAGLWSSILSRMGCDVVAYDAHPPGLSSESTNEYVGTQSYFDVKKGDATSVFSDGVDGRALLMIWPNNSDNVDNPHLVCSDSGEDSSLTRAWDLDCLKKYHNAGGESVIYVGEREAKILLTKGATGGDCGFCSSRGFQRFLEEHYTLQIELECPTWWLKLDDVTIWKRRRYSTRSLPLARHT
ncbi:hypothetical protein THAOC_02119 [Thalassiosira oceanica]|uniref:Uncharacterized protein n=1 Tax=Thalassiosira oceanica TaxID=159749 RepID=K0TQJ1_THAOC|nr:hypothetical protein THAOC_02119 [Thalassiosira oceanica]|eukprot:EJK76137.1 hypothetical protein THAOC_02119 [Thalassiosira oceanica]